MKSASGHSASTKPPSPSGVSSASRHSIESSLRRIGRGVVGDGVLHPPLDVADPDRRARELGGERVDLDAVQNFRPDARHDHAEAERFAFEDGAIFDVLDRLQREIEEIAGAAGRVEDAQAAQPVDEGVALRLRLGARGEEFLSRAALAALPPPPAAASAGAMIASISAFAVSHSRRSGRATTGSTIIMILSGSV